MMINHVPRLNSDNPTGCCPRFLPKEWDGKTVEFQDKKFVRMETASFFYIPLNLGQKMTSTWAKITEISPIPPKDFITMSYDLSPWKCEHYLSVDRDIPGLENVRLTGTFLMKVYEGPYKDAPKWIESMKNYIKSKKKIAEKIFLYYTTCPKCQKFYGKNYVVALAKLS